MANTLDLNSADRVRIDHPHMDKVGIANGLDDGKLEEGQRASSARHVSNTTTNNKSDQDINGKAKVSEEEILAPRGLRRIIINFTPS
jgi:hypothetical protein